MKKSIKVISTLLLAIMLVASIAGTVLAVDPNTVLNGLNGNGNVQTNDLTKVGNNIVTIIQVVGIVIAVIVLLVIGIKYMMGSASEKAEYSWCSSYFCWYIISKSYLLIINFSINKIIFHKYYISITIKLKVHVNALFFVFRLHFVTICAII